MLKRFIFLVIGILMIISLWQKFMYFDVRWIILCFVLFIVTTFVSVHNKNKERDTPKPVYLAKP